jgi:tRNA U54 and U55 pseudouridine synthase Pus10
MPCRTKTSRVVAVHLATAAGVVFSGMSHGFSLQTDGATIEVTSAGESYLSLSGRVELTVRTLDEVRTFILQNANGSLRPSRFSALAETIREKTGPAVEFTLESDGIRLERTASVHAVE